MRILLRNLRRYKLRKDVGYPPFRSPLRYLRAADKLGEAVADVAFAGRTDEHRAGDATSIAWYVESQSI